MNVHDRLFCGFFVRMLGTWLLGYLACRHVGAWALLSLPAGFLWGGYWLERQ